MGAVWLTTSSTRGPESGVPRFEEVAAVENSDEGGQDDSGEELVSLFDSYLLETASTDELMGQMEVIDSRELVAMFVED